MGRERRFVDVRPLDGLTVLNPVTALTFYVCRNDRCPVGAYQDPFQVARQIRERVGTGQPLHPPAALCPQCSTPMRRLAETAEPEPYDVGVVKIREYVAALTA